MLWAKIATSLLMSVAGVFVFAAVAGVFVFAAPAITVVAVFCFTPSALLAIPSNKSGNKTWREALRCN